ncbi:ROK family glucokinase [Streptacidiphilus sp. EB129]|uniref:ROK family glucokinase n=1 Tax=Streptacidiphilus sp. EB129 TaxID=3156262 RepID=UPI0035129516
MVDLGLTGPETADRAATLARTGTLTVGVDVGGTKIAAGLVDERGAVLHRLQVPTPTDRRGIATAIDGLIDQLVDQGGAGRQQVQAVGVGAAGYIDETRSTVRFSPNLDWHDEPLKQLVEGHCGLPAVIENDANAAAWGEFAHGAVASHGGGGGSGAQGLDRTGSMVMVTVGTGLGGGIVTDGALWRGAFGSGGEIGHYRAVPGGLPCHCGHAGCMEQYASGTAHTRRAREAAAAAPERAVTLLSLGDGTPQGIQGHQLVEAARSGDPVAVEAFQCTGRWLGQALADLSAVLDPGVFVIGGGVSEAGDLLLAPTRDAYLAALPGAGHRPPAEILMAALGPDAGLVGAADLARRR